jgi:3-hydroxyisobutyrate dehydrogenase
MKEETTLPTVGFIGLGIMGGAMTARLAAAGYALHLHNRSRAKAQAQLAAGASWHDTPASVAAASDVVVTIVGTPEDVRALYLGDDGLIAHARPGSVLIDMTTSSPALAREIADMGMARSIAVLDAPVSGGDVGAREGRLSIMVGGDGRALMHVKPILQCLGTKIVLQGGPGAGQHTKLCNQIVIASTLLGICEGLSYASRASLDLQTVLSAIGGGAADSFQLNNLGPRIIGGDFAPGFMIEHLIKDMRIAADEASQMGHALPGLELVRSLFAQLADAGYARAGTHALFKMYDTEQPR